MRIKRWSIALTSIALLGGGYWYFFVHASSAVAAPNQVMRVSLGSIASSVKTTGKISPVQTTVLSFSKQGTISKLYKKVGESVKAGDVIAEIDAKSARLDIRSAEINLSNAQNSLNKLLSGVTGTDRVKAENTQEDSEARLRELEKDYENLLVEKSNTLSGSEMNILALESKLTLAKNELTYLENNTITSNTVSTTQEKIGNAYKTIETIYNSLYATLTSIDSIILVESTYNSQRGAIASNNPSLRTQVDELYATVKKAREDEIPKFTEVKNNSNSLTSVLIGLTDMKQLVEDFYSLSTLSLAALRASAPGSIYLSDTTLNSKVSDMTAISEKLSISLNDIENAITDLKNIDNTSLADLGTANTLKAKEISVKSIEDELIKAKQSLIQSRGSYEVKILTSKQAIESQKNTIKLNSMTYQELISGSSTDVVSARNSVRSASISVEKATLALRDYQIIAPFDGVVNDIPWKIGDTTVATEGVLIENKNAYEIGLSLDQIDIVKIQEGLRANIVLDAFPTETYTGRVSRVSEVPTETSGVVSYEAVVELTIPRNDIYTKMSATVEVITTEKENIITIPSSAITTEGGRSYVNKAVDPSIFTRLMETNRPLGASGSQSPSFSGRVRGEGTGSGSFSASGRVFSGSGGMMGSGRSFSGALTSGSGNTRNTPSRRGVGGAAMTISTSESIATEKIEITIGISSNGQTEIISGLSAGDVIIIVGKMSTAKSTSTTSSTTRVPGAGGFGGGRPPGL